MQNAFLSFETLLRIISIARNGSDVVITYQASAGPSHRLERKPALTAGDWLPILGVNDQTPVVAGPAQFTDPGAIGLGAAFYRVRLVP